jgi:hypothetical protein
MIRGNIRKEGEKRIEKGVSWLRSASKNRNCLEI